jgi:hypothetical protein
MRDFYILANEYPLTTLAIAIFIISIVSIIEDGFKRKK